MEGLDTEELERECKPGSKPRYRDRRLRHIVRHTEDDGAELVPMKTRVNFGWSYKAEDIRVSAYTAGMCSGEPGAVKMKRK